MIQPKITSLLGHLLRSTVCSRSSSRGHHCINISKKYMNQSRICGNFGHQNGLQLQNSANQFCLFSSLLKQNIIDSQSSEDQTDNKTDAEEKARIQIENLTPEEQKKFKILQLEFDVLQSQGNRLPNNMNNQQWLKIFELPSANQRLKMYKYWCKSEAEERRVARKKEERRIKREQMMAERGGDDPSERSYANKIMMHVYEGTMVKHYYNNLAHAMMHGLPLVIDMGFEENMTNREKINLIVQLEYAHAKNKVAKDPFHLVFANANPHAFITQTINKKTRGIFSAPYTVTDKCVTDLYPRDRVVYLSPNAPKVLNQFNADEVYVIGGIVDLAQEKPLTFGKAKKDNVRCAKLPLDKYLDWQTGSKSLALDHMMGIMLDWKDHNPWEDILNKHVPKRKVRPQKHGKNKARIANMNMAWKD